MFAWAGDPRNAAAYNAARRRRSAGVSFKRIAKELEISPATAHRWTRDIELAPGQLQRPRPDRAVVEARVASWRRRCRGRREAYQQAGRERARCGDELHLAGCMLYWAEGSKSRNTAKLVNSDPELIAFFCRFLGESLNVSDADMRLALNVYLGNSLTIEEIEAYWLDRLQLPRSCLRKHSVNSKPTSSSGRKKNKLPFGVATVSVPSTELVQHIYGAIQEYGGFERPEWLD